MNIDLVDLAIMLMIFGAGMVIGSLITLATTGGLG